jgi:CotS family spore coat protein
MRHDRATILRQLEENGFPQEILDVYDLPVLQVQPVRKVMRLFSERGDFVLKRFIFGRKNLDFSLAAMIHLRNHGFVGVPWIERTREGTLYTEVDGIHYIIMSWQPGRESDYERIDHLALATRTLAELHAKSRGFVPPDVPGKVQYGTWIDHFQERIGEMERFVSFAREEDSAFARMYAETGAYFISEAKCAVEHLLKSPYEELSEKARIEREFCHHDFAHHNVLIGDGPTVSVVDFDYAICDARTHDIASLILRNMKHTGWDGRTARFILRAYDQCTKLMKGETDLIYGMLRFPQDFWEAGYFYYIEKNRPLEVLEKRLRKWNEMRELREEFLQDFKENADYVIRTGTLR